MAASSPSEMTSRASHGSDERAQIVSVTEQLVGNCSFLNPPIPQFFIRLVFIRLGREPIPEFDGDHPHMVAWHFARLDPGKSGVAIESRYNWEHVAGSRRERRSGT
ncbi:MAG: hypothetical protein M3357_12180 [Actinomycetota bacterium]|nr:hypothetical protein [Actinomycetota bacterium]